MPKIWFYPSLTASIHSASRLLLITGFLLSSCQSPTDSDLMAANTALSAMVTTRNLKNSCFGVAYPEGGAENFIRYLFSDLGSAEWPVAFDALEREQMAAAGQTPIPANVVISALDRQYPDRKELVLQAQTGQITAQGYLPEETTPHFEALWELGPAVTNPTPDPLMVPLCESNIDMGMGIDGLDPPAAEPR
ncbi:MAG: hypothetical protein ACO4AI_14080 [Prochlorothrix sp.]|nr:hypothetical protein [Prochlorothrix sp.]